VPAKKKHTKKSGSSKNLHGYSVFFAIFFAFLLKRRAARLRVKFTRINLGDS